MRQQYTIALDQKAVAAKRSQALGVMRYELNQSLPLPLGEYEKEVLCDFLGIYEALHDGLRHAVNDEFPAQVKLPFLSMYAVDVAAQHVLKRHGLERGQEKRYAITGFPGLGNGEERRETLFRSPFQEYLSRRSAVGSNPKERLGELLSSFSEAARAAARDGRYAELRGLTDAFQVTLDGDRYAGLNGNGPERVLAVPALVTEKAVVGNEEMMSGLWTAIYGLSHFDGKENPLRKRLALPSTVSIQGDPGTGKTMGIRQCYFAAKRDLEPRMRVPLKLFSLTNAIKSSLFAESAKNLRGEFQTIRESEAAYLIVADDIESIIHDRRGLSHSPEEKNITNTLLNELQGLFTEEKGNYLLVSTSNHQLSVDPALDDRLSQLVLFAPGPRTPREYARIFQSHLSEGIAAGYVRIDDWDAVGNYAEQVRIKGQKPRPLSGRHVQDIVTGLVVQDVLRPMTMSNRPLTETEMSEAFAQPLITTKGLEEAIERFAAAKARSYDEEKETRIAERVLDLEVEVEARRRLKDDRRP